jgi:hypothetical protein
MRTATTIERDLTLEPGLGDWIVYDDANNNGMFDAAELNTLSDSTGEYAFAELSTGTHHIRIIPQSEWTAIEPAGFELTILNANTSRFSGLNFGEVRNNSVYGYVFEDRNGNNTIDLGLDPGLSGRTVYLDADDDGIFNPPPATTINSTDVPATIPVQASPILVTSKLTVAGWNPLTNPVVDVNVTLNISHTYDSDLQITLIAYGGDRRLSVTMVSMRMISATNS